VAGVPVVLLEELCEWDAFDHHLGILGPSLESRPLGRPAEQDDLEPGVFDPTQVGDDTRHRHKGRGRKDGSVGIPVGQPFTFPVNDRALHVEPAESWVRSSAP
jgi:hypothetical protein